MRELLSAGLQRYRKSLAFWVTLFISLVFGIIAGVITEENPFHGTEITYFVGPFLAIAIQISLMIGIEFSNGVIRNKLMIGHSKGSVFFSELLLSLLSATLQFVVFYGAFAVLTARIYSKITARDMLLFVIGLWLLHMSFAVICTAVCYFIPYYTALAAILNIVLIPSMMFVSSELHQKLNVPEYIRYGFYNDEGEFVAERNPNAIPHDSAKYALLHTAYYLMPYGQLMEHEKTIDYQPFKQSFVLFDDKMDELKTAPLCSFLVIGAFTAAGLISFRKRDLK